MGTTQVTDATLDAMSPVAVARFGVRAIPNLVLVRSGRVAEQIVGAVPPAKLGEAIQRAPCPQVWRPTGRTPLRPLRAGGRGPPPPPGQGILPGSFTATPQS